MLPDWKPNDVVVNGAHFNYYRTPKAPGASRPVLVLQHGFSDNGLCWAPVAKALAAAGAAADYDILMPDARGHGRSARVTPGEAIDQAADLAGLLRALGVSRAVVAGHSMGAQIAAELAARFPELVTAIVLEDPPWFAPRLAPAPGAKVEEWPVAVWLRTLRDKSVEEIMADCRLEHPTWPEAYVRPWCQGKKDLDPNFKPMAGEPSHWETIVPAIRCPALLITADPGEGGIVTPEIARQVQALNPNFKVINFPGVGHHIRFARHDAYLQAFSAFIKEVA
jgi:pimeloyl-ACP methyl ester carboxylesterase